MSRRPGSLYRVCGRLYVDSQAVLNLVGKHEVVEHPGGWRVLADDGAVVCAAVEGRPTLPRQRGALYALAAVGDVRLKERCTAWATQGLVEPAGKFETWPGLPASACNHACACGPCKARQHSSNATSEAPEPPPTAPTNTQKAPDRANSRPVARGSRKKPGEATK